MTAASVAGSFACEEQLLETAYAEGCGFNWQVWTFGVYAWD